MRGADVANRSAVVTAVTPTVSVSLLVDTLGILLENACQVLVAKDPEVSSMCNLIKVVLLWSKVGFIYAPSFSRDTAVSSEQWCSLGPEMVTVSSEQLSKEVVVELTVQPVALAPLWMIPTNALSSDVPLVACPRYKFYEVLSACSSTTQLCPADDAYF